MDKIDIKILTMLRDNARLTASAISDEISLSVSAVIERIKKLESRGVIKGYTIDIDQSKLGNNIAASMEIALKHPDYYDEFVDIVNKNPNITDCYYQTGKYDFVIHIVTDSAEGLEEVYKSVKGFEGVATTETHFVLKTIKEESCVYRKE